MTQIKPILDASGRRLKACDLSAKGVSQAEIARQLGVTPAAIHNTLKKAAQLFNQQAADLRGREIQRQSLSLEKVLNQAWLMWETTADIRFLQEVRAALADLRKLWSLEVTQTKHTGPPSTVIQANSYDVKLANLPMDVIEKLMSSSAPHIYNEGASQNVPSQHSEIEHRSNIDEQKCLIDETKCCIENEQIPKIESEEWVPSDGAIQLEDHKLQSKIEKETYSKDDKLQSNLNKHASSKIENKNAFEKSKINKHSSPTEGDNNNEGYSNVEESQESGVSGEFTKGIDKRKVPRRLPTEETRVVHLLPSPELRTAMDQEQQDLDSEFGSEND